MSVREPILEHLQPLVGLRLSIARRAGAMRGFHFGEVRPLERGNAGEFALHIECPWRMDGPDGIVTGWTDIWRYPGPRPPEGWTWDHGPNLQDQRLAELLGGFDEATGSYVNATELLVVESVAAGHYGDVRIYLSGHHRLVIFPDASVGEHWRIFRCHTDDPHFVAEGNWAGAP
jgi:hypothetical protein